MAYPRSISAFLLAAIPILFGGCQEKAKPVPVYSMGDKVTAGHLVYTALETQWLTQLGQGANQRIPQNRFLVIHVAVTNSGGSQATVPNFTVEDDRGSSFAELTNGDQLAEWMSSLKLVSPTDSIQGTILFDVVPRHYRLRVFDENAQQSALIDIPLNVSPDAPTLPGPQSRE
jgi:hypothetical protein